MRAVAWFDTADAAAQRVGLGTAVSRRRRGGGGSAARARAASFCSRPKITFRAQPHGTFKFLFNGIYYGAATPARLGVAQTTAGQQQ